MGARGYVLAGLVLAAAMGTALASWAMQVSEMPFGDMDGIGIWNTRAAFLLCAGGEWATVLSTQLSHPDYPLHVPLLVARSWAYAGSVEPSAPMLISALWPGLTACLLYGAVAGGSSSRNGMLAAAMFLATPQVVHSAASQAADGALAFYVTLGVGSIMLAHHGHGPRPALWYALGGVASGAAAWTKNEGLLFCVVMLLWLGVKTIRERRSVGLLGGYLAGCAAPLLALAHFKLCLAPRGDLWPPPDSTAAWRHLWSADRWIEVAGAWGRQLIWFGTTVSNGMIGVVPLLLLGLWIGRCRKSVEIAGPSIVVLAMGVGYMVAHVTTPYDLQWHLLTSTQRLMLQLWPASLLVVFASRKP